MEMECLYEKGRKVVLFLLDRANVHRIFRICTIEETCFFSEDMV